MTSRRGFTLIEILVVVAIVALLAALLLPAIRRVYIFTLREQCHNNLAQIHKSLEMYRIDNSASPGIAPFPSSLSVLFDKGYMPDPAILLCPFDGTGGAEGGKPDGPDIDQFAELAAEENHPHSYMYEMSGAECSWEWRGLIGPASQYFTSAAQLPDLDGEPGCASWAEVKLAQLRYGDLHLHTNTLIRSGYPTSKFPVLRCFWHVADANTNDYADVSNLSFSGSVFTSGAYWETLVTGYTP